MFDPAIQPTVQSMCIKLMMNLIESFVITEKNHPDQPVSLVQLHKLSITMYVLFGVDNMH